MTFLLPDTKVRGSEGRGKGEAREKQRKEGRKVKENEIKPGMKGRMKDKENERRKGMEEKKGEEEKVNEVKYDK